MGVPVDQGAGKPEISGSDAAEIMVHLRHVLDSAPFHSSPRSCQFLRYVVESALAGENEHLKERLIGERVFGRRSDYDTGQDSIVRTKANEVRRRLAQYYDLNPHAPWRIELSAGSYIPLIHPGQQEVAVIPAAPPDVLPLPSTRHRLYWLAAAVISIIVAGAAWTELRHVRQTSLFSIFWDPFFSGPHDLILCIPTPEMYRIYGTGRGKLIAALQPRPPGQAMPEFPMAEAESVQIVSESGVSVGLGDAHAMTLVYAFAMLHGKTPQIRLGNDTTFTELRSGQNILIGGFTNRWTIDLMKDARYVFASQGGEYGIRDKTNGTFICEKQRPWQPRRNEDCAVVTRLVDSKTGHPLLVAAGLDHFGTFAVGEFLTRPDLLEPALRRASPGWQNKNLQIVFRIEIVRDNVGPPQVLATHVW